MTQGIEKQSNKIINTMKLGQINQFIRKLLGLLLLNLSATAFGQKNLFESSYRHNSSIELVNYIETFKGENSNCDKNDLGISDTVKFVTCLIRQFYRHFNVNQGFVSEIDSGLIDLDSCNCKNDNYYGFFNFPSVYFIPKLILEEFDVANSKEFSFEKHLMHSGKLKGKYINFNEKNKSKLADSSYGKYIKLINLKFSDKFNRDLNHFLNEKKYSQKEITSKIDFLKPHLKFFQKKNKSYTIYDLCLYSLVIDVDLDYVIIKYSQKHCVIASLYKINQMQSLEFIYSKIIICGQP